MTSMPLVSCPDCGRDVSTLAGACPHCGRTMAAHAMRPPQAFVTTEEETLWRGTPSPKVLIGRGAGLLLTLIVVLVAAHIFASFTADLTTQSRVIAAGWWVAAAGFVVPVVT